MTSYEYAGYMQNLIPTPESGGNESVPEVLFQAQDLALWQIRDRMQGEQTPRIPAYRVRQGNVVKFSGRFDEVKRIDTAPTDQPMHWVSLSSYGWKDDRFPIDALRYPILEVTYRCTGDGLYPKLAWTYPGGMHLVDLPTSPQWRTIARRIPWSGFPGTIDSVTIRLYSTVRATQMMEIQSIRFRESNSLEQETLSVEDQNLRQMGLPPRHEVLETWMPVGVCMDAATSRRLAEMLGVTLGEYWALALEDIVKRHHNCIAIDNISQLTPGEWDILLQGAQAMNIKLAVSLDLPDHGDLDDWLESVEAYVRPGAMSGAVHAWTYRGDPPENRFRDFLAVRDAIAQTDPSHPFCLIARSMGLLPLFSSHLAVSGIHYSFSRDPWALGRIVRTHASLAKDSRFWVEAPAHVAAGGVMEWCTSPEIRLMANTSFANGARGWFAAYYHNDPTWLGGSCEQSLTGAFLGFSDLWSELDICMERFIAIAPMLLHARPARLPAGTYVESISSHENAQLPVDMEATSLYRLKGGDYSFFILVSNDIRGMTSVNAHIPQRALKGTELYDLTDFFRTRTWTPMELDRHVEMFPGQARIILAAKPLVCAYWRNAIAWYLAEDDRRQLAFNMDLASAYGLNTSPVEETMRGIRQGDDLHNLQLMDKASDMLINLLYAEPTLSEARGKLTEALAAIGAADAVLSRLVVLGKADIAHEWGTRVIPLGREITHLRLELRRGRSAEIVSHCADIAARTRKTFLEDIATLVDPPPQRTAPLSGAFSMFE